MSHKLLLLPGDGIGPEVMAEAVRVLERVQEHDGEFRLNLTLLPWGADYYFQHGHAAPEDFLEQLRGFDAILLGAVGDFRLGPCLAVRSGYVIGRARGLSDGRNSGAPWLSSGLDVRLQWQVSDVVALQLTWGVEVGIVRPIFGIQGSATQYTLPNINSAGGIGIALFL